MVTFKWTDMDIGDKKVLETTPKHTLGDWAAIAVPRKGRGVIEVIQGAAPVPPEPIRKMLLVDNVQSVITIDGMFVVVVKDQRRWLGVIPEIESALAIELEGHLDAVDNPT